MEAKLLFIHHGCTEGTLVYSVRNHIYISDATLKLSMEFSVIHTALGGPHNSFISNQWLAHT